MTITLTAIMKDQYYPCYFCQRPILGGLGQVHWRCQPCTEEHQVYQVLTTPDADDYETMRYAHIYPTEKLQVRLHLKDQLTCIEDAYHSECPIKLPGFPLTLSNVKKKVKLYLTFS